MIRSTWAVGVPGVAARITTPSSGATSSNGVGLSPGAPPHFEAIHPETARQILHAYGRGYRVFSDVQGTGAVVLAAVYAGIRVTGIPMRYQTVVAFGAGATGVAIADQLRDAMVADGATEEQARSQIWLVDTPVLVGLTETVDEAAPTILLGTSAVEGAFTRPVIEAMCRATSRPLILPVWARPRTRSRRPRRHRPTSSPGRAGGRWWPP